MSKRRPHCANLTTISESRETEGCVVSGEADDLNDASMLTAEFLERQPVRIKLVENVAYMQINGRRWRQMRMNFPHRNMMMSLYATLGAGRTPLPRVACSGHSLRAAQNVSWL